MAYRIGLLPALFLALLLTFWGCNGDEVTNINQNGTESFSVTCRVLSHADGAALAGATFDLLTTGTTGTSDAQGLFHLEGLAPGTHMVVVSAPGHATSQVTLTLSEADLAKDFHAHRDISLAEATATLAVQVVDSQDGQPLEGVPVEVSSANFSPWISGHAIAIDADQYTAVTDSAGRATLTDLPAARVVVSALTCDTDGDDVADHFTTTLSNDLEPGEVSEGHIFMPNASSVIPTIVDGNLPENYLGTRVTDSYIWLVFSAPMDTSPDRTNVSLQQDNTPYELVPCTAEWVSPFRLEITSPAVLDNTNMDYDFTLSVFSQAGGPLTVTRTFYWNNGGTPAPGNCEEEVTDLSLAFAHPDINYLTSSVALRWSAVACAGGYRIHARDNHNNLGWVFLGTEPSDYETGEIEMEIVLPAAFDRYDVDELQTPFAGIDVTFCVVPLNAAEPEPGEPHAMLTIRDQVAPVIEDIEQQNSATNDDTMAKPLRIQVLFSEYIDAEAPDPVLTVSEAGGDPDFTLDPADATWTWDQGRRSGHFTFLLEPGVDASRDVVQVTVTDLTDLSGNTTAGPQNSTPVPLDGWGNFFDFEGAAMGWTRDGEGWEWGTPSIGPLSGHLSVRCWGLSMDTNYGQDWDTSLYSPWVRICEESPELRFWIWYDTYNSSHTAYVYVRNEFGTEYMMASYSYSSSGWVEKTLDLAGMAGQRIQIIYRFVSTSYGTDPGVFLDDILIGCEER